MTGPERSKKYRRLQSGKFGAWKKLIDKGIESLPDIVKFVASKIRNKNVLRALDADIANDVVEEAQNRAQNQLNNSNNLFG